MVWNPEWWKYIVSVDVETWGLHGPVIAVGAVVFKEGVEVDQFYRRCKDPNLGWEADPEDRSFVEKYVLPAIGEPSARTPSQIGEEFWIWWGRHRDAGATMVCDCPWPVEARFLSGMVARDTWGRKYGGPYPLIDVASVIVANGGDPLATTERRADELPVHRPVADARQSARQLLALVARDSG